MAAGHADHKDGHSCTKPDTSTKDAPESCCANKDSASCRSGKDANACAKDDITPAGCGAGKADKDKEMGAGTDGKPGRCGGGQGAHDHHDHAAPVN